MSKYCLGPYLFKSPGLGESDSILIDQQKTRRVATSAPRGQSSKPTSDAILLKSIDQDALTIQYWDIPSAFGRTYGFQASPEKVLITSFENGLQYPTYGSSKFPFGAISSTENKVQLNSPCRAVFDFDGRTFEVVGIESEDYGLFSTSSVGFGDPIDPDYREMPNLIPVTDTSAETAALPAFPIVQRGEQVEPEGQAKWSVAANPSVVIEYANNPAVATLCDGRSILVHESVDEKGNITLAARIIATSVERKILYYRSLSMGRLVNGSSPLTFETFDDLYVAANAGVPNKTIYIGFLTGPLKGQHARVTRFERQADVYNDGRPRFKNIFQLNASVNWESSNDINDVRWFLSEGAAPITTESLTLTPHYADGSIGYTAQIANPTVAVAENNQMPSGEQSIFIAYQAFTNGQWNVYARHLIYTNGLLYTPPSYETPYNFQAPDLTQTTLSGSVYSDVVYEVISTYDAGNEVYAAFTVELLDGRRVFNCSGQSGTRVYGPGGLSLDEGDAGVFVTFYKNLCPDKPDWYVGAKFIGPFPPSPETLGFTGAASTGTRKSYSQYPTGITLQRITGQSYPYISALTTYSNLLIAVGGFKSVNSLLSTQNIFKWDSGAAVFAPINYDAFMPVGAGVLNGSLYVWGPGYPYIMRWVGPLWAAGGGFGAGSTLHMSFYGGELIRSNGTLIYRLASGTTWTVLANSGAPPNCAGLLASLGSLWTISNVTSSTCRVYKWNGLSYSIEANANGQAYCMLEFDGKLLVGGSLTRLADADIGVNGIAAFDGSNWSNFGGISGLSVKAMSASSESLFVAGQRGSTYEIWTYWKTTGTWRLVDSSTLEYTKLCYLNGHLYASLKETDTTGHEYLLAFLESDESYNECFDIVPTPEISEWCYYDAVCHQHFVYGDMYCPSPYIAVKYKPDDVYVLSKGDEKVTRVLYRMSVYQEIEDEQPQASSVSSLSYSEPGPVAKSDCGDFQPSAVMECSVSPNSLSFGTVFVMGEYSDLSFELTKQTEGTVVLVIDGANAGDFTFVSTDTQNWIGYVGPIPTTIGVRFTPSSNGSKTAQIVSDCAFLDCSTTIPMTAAAAFAAICEVIPSTVDFGTAIDGSTPIKSFVVRNAGGSTLAGSAVFSSNDGEFSLVGDASFSLGPTEEKTIYVMFTPSISNLGARTAIIDLQAGCTVSVTGVSSEVVQCDVDQSILAFPRLRVGTSSELEVWVTNTSLDISQGDVLTGTIYLDSDGDQFSITSGGGSFQLLPGDSYNIRIRFAPTAAGLWSRVLHIGDQCANVTVRGESYLLSACEVSPDSLNFGDIPTNEESFSYVTVSHLSGGVATGTITLEQAGSAFRIVSGGGDYWLDVGQSRTVQIGCLPIAEGVYAATLRTGCGNAAIRAVAKDMFEVGDILERDLEGYENSFLKPATILVTYDGDLTEYWPQDKESFEFVDNAVSGTEPSKGLLNFPFKLADTPIFGIDPVHINGDLDKWVYFQGRGPLSLSYNQFGVPGCMPAQLPFQSDPILIDENAFRPKVSVNNRNHAVIAYEKNVAGSMQICLKGTGDFAQDSVVGPKSSRLTKPVASADFAFSHVVTNPGLNQLCDIAIDRSDVTHLVWQSNADGYWNVYYACARDCFEPQQVTRSESRSGFPDIDVDSEGNVFVVYHDNRFGAYQILLSQKSDHRYPPLIEQDAYLAGYRSGITHYVNVLPILVTNSADDAGVYHVHVEFYDNQKLEGLPQVVVDSRIDIEAFIGQAVIDPYYDQLDLAVGSGVYLTPGQAGYLNFDASLFRPGANHNSYPYGFDTNKTYYPKVFIVDKYGDITRSESPTIGTLSCTKCVRVASNTLKTSMCSYSFVSANVGVSEQPNEPPTTPPPAAVLFMVAYTDSDYNYDFVFSDAPISVGDSMELRMQWSNGTFYPPESIEIISSKNTIRLTMGDIYLPGSRCEVRAGADIVFQSGGTLSVPAAVDLT
jgi:hypothetical protein